MKNNIIRFAAHKIVDSKLQFKVYRENLPYATWELADGFRNDDELLAEYWRTSAVQYVNKSVQTNISAYDLQNSDLNVNKDGLVDICKNIPQNKKEPLSAFPSIQIDKIVDNKTVYFHDESLNELQMDFEMFKLMFPQDLAIFFVNNA